jgi:tRNA threonylcarbamoyl adenosine modification protein YeaZ
MKTLAIEFSSNQRSVAVLADGPVCGEAVETATRETHAFGLIEQAFAKAKMEREEIQCLAIGLGPGSYTGIRSALALAQGWQLGRPVQLIGISSVECLAAEAQTKGLSGKINIIIDAQRNEFHLAVYNISITGNRELEPLRLAAMDEVRARYEAGELVAGPDVDRWFKNGIVVFPGAAVLGRLAGDRAGSMAGEQLEPIYLRETSFVKAPAARVLPSN